MIEREYLRKIRQVEIRTRRLAEEYLAGAYRSVFKGRGMDFESVRNYVAGDEVRFIDWNVSARMNATHVKEFKEERELVAMLVVDVSASGDLASGQQSKRELAAELAACFAFSAVSNGDRVGLVLFSDRIEKYVPPRKGRTQVLRIVREVLGCAPTGRGTSLKQALNFVNQVQTRRAVTFLISDFMDSGFERVLKVTARRHDLIPVVVSDPREQLLPDAGWIVVQDAETGEVVEIDTGDPEVRTAFAELTAQRRVQRRQELRRMGVDSIELITDQSYTQPIRQYMDRRVAQRYP